MDTLEAPSNTIIITTHTSFHFQCDAKKDFNRYMWPYFFLPLQAKLLLVLLCKLQQLAPIS